MEATDIKFRLSVKTGTEGDSVSSTPDESLGKYMATTPITDATLANLFRNITGPEAEDGITLYRCIFVLNDSADPWGSVAVWIASQVPGGGTVAIGLDPVGVVDRDDSDPQAAEVADETTAPTGVTFRNPTTVYSGLDVGTIPAGKVFAVWLRLIVPPGATAVATDAIVIAVGSSVGGDFGEDFDPLGVREFDGVVRPEWPGAEGAVVYNATGAPVSMFTTLQAALDAAIDTPYHSGDGTGLMIKVNRNNGNGGDVIYPLGGLNWFRLVGFAHFGGLAEGISGFGDFDVGSTDIVIIEDASIDVLHSSGYTGDHGMFLKLRRVDVDSLRGGICGDAFSVGMQECFILDWLFDDTHQAPDNNYCRFRETTYGSIFNPSNIGIDPGVIAGQYVFDGCMFRGLWMGNGDDWLGFAIVGDCHITFRNCIFSDQFAGQAYVQTFELDGATLTIDFDGCTFVGSDVDIIKFVDHGGGGTVNVRINGEGQIDHSAEGTIVVNEL